VKDGAGDTANITLLGQYIAAGKSASSAGLSPSTLFHLDHDSNAGTLVTTTFRPAIGA
jgi:hypothetical protein